MVSEVGFKSAGACSDIFMWCFLLYIVFEAEHPKSLIPNFERNGQNIFILPAEMCLRGPIEDCVNLGCGNHTSVEIYSHIFVNKCNILDFGNQKNMSFLLIPKSQLSWRKMRGDFF